MDFDRVARRVREQGNDDTFPPDRELAPDAPICSVFVTASVGGRLRRYGDISLPSREALVGSRTWRAAERLQQFLGEPDVAPLQEFLRRVRSSEHMRHMSQARGLPDQLRRTYAEAADRNQAVEGLGLYLTHLTPSAEEAAARICAQTLADGTPRQRDIVLRAMVRAEFLPASLVPCAASLLSRHECFESVLELVSLGQASSRPLAAALSSKLGDLMGSELERRGPWYEQGAAALATWCAATNDHSLCFQMVNSASATERAAALELMSRTPAVLEDNLSTILDGLDDPSRLVVREALVALQQLGVRGAPYGQEVVRVGFEVDDYVTAVALETLTIYGVRDEHLCEEIVSRLEPYQLIQSDEDLQYLETVDGQASLFELVPLTRAAVRLLPEFASSLAPLLRDFVGHRSSEVSCTAVGALVVAKEFKSIEKLLEETLDLEPRSIELALRVAAQYGREALPWFRYAVSVLTRARAGLVRPDHSELARLCAVASEYCRSFDGPRQ